MPDLADAGEVLTYLLGFWAFLFNAKFRARCLQTWATASPRMRLLHGLEAVIATVVGLGVPALLAWLIATGLGRGAA